MPPWQPMKVVAETESLADGRAVLGLPGGLRWVAQHDPAGFDPPHRFVDVLVIARARRRGPPRIVGRWTHTHEFSEAPGGHAGVRPRRHLGARGGAALDVRLPAPAARRRPGRAPRRARRRPAAARRRRHRRVGSGRLGADGVSEHRRAPGDPAGPPAGAQSTTSGSGIRTGPAPDLLSGRRRRRAPGRRVDRRALHRRAQGGDPRQPHRADPAPRRGRGADATTGRARSSAPRRSVSTASTAATRAVRGKPARRRLPRRCGRGLGGRDRRPPPRRGCGWSPCAPASCSPPAAARCG